MRYHGWEDLTRTFVIVAASLFCCFFGTIVKSVCDRTDITGMHDAGRASLLFTKQ